VKGHRGKQYDARFSQFPEFSSLGVRRDPVHNTKAEAGKHCEWKHWGVGNHSTFWGIKTEEGGETEESKVVTSLTKEKGRF